MKRYIQPENDLSPKNRELINRAWDALVAHVDRTSHVEGNIERRAALYSLEVVKNKLFEDQAWVQKSLASTLAALLPEHLGPVVVSWPFVAFRLGMEWLQERAISAGLEEGKGAPSIVSTLRHFEQVCQNELVLNLHECVATPQVHDFIKHALIEEGWRGTWTGNLEQVDRVTRVILVPANTSYGIYSLRMSGLMQVNSDLLGIDEPFDRWYLVTELESELTAEMERRRMEAQELTIKAGDLFKSGNQIRAYLNRL